MPSTPRLDEALDAWRMLVGPDHVLAGGPELAAAGRATFATAQRPAALLRPGTRQEVQECVRIANRCLVPLHAVSTGKNWGFGSRVPPLDGAVVMELRRMDRVVHFDETLGTITVEPGVTFEAAHRFLRARRSRLFLSTTGGSPHASLIGNALERGDGSGPLGDRFAHACAMEVVLSTGECVHTGFGRFEGSPVATLHRWGVGPSLDGLFSQSALGVVTRMTFWLTPLPACLHLARFEIDRPEGLGPLIEVVRGLRMDGTIRSAVGIWNDYRVASTLGQYPWALTGGATPLSPEHLAALQGDGSHAAWHGSFALYAPTLAQGRANLAHAEGCLRPVVSRFSVVEHAGDPASGELSPGDPAALFAQGIPHEESLRSVYWRKKTPPPAHPDPDRDGCGVVWVCPVVPLRGEDALRAVGPARRTMLDHGFEPLLAMVAQTERTLYLVPLLVYDRDVPGADEQARSCHDALLSRFREQGYLPHRLGLCASGALPPPADDHEALMERLRQALDPDGILCRR